MCICDFYNYLLLCRTAYFNVVFDEVLLLTVQYSPSYEKIIVPVTVFII